jgi:hypothetical protein
MATPPNELHQKQSSEPNYLKWILIGCGALIVVSIGLSLIGTAIWYYVARSPDRSSPGARRPLFGSSNVKLVEAHGIQTVAKT